jgi:SepF-like predicted cell division protein (DUF552 family)/predicted DNA-binding WGR domain protein
MNNILQLRGQLIQKPNPAGGGPVNIPVGKVVKAEHMEALKTQLEQILKYWENDKSIQGALVSVYYYHVVAKSNRIKGLLCEGSSDPNEAIRGSKFYGENPIQHVFTYYVKLDVLKESIKRLSDSVEIVNKRYGGKITYNDITDIHTHDPHSYKTIARTNFVNVIRDCYYVEKFNIDRDINNESENTIITIYKTDVKTVDLLQSIGINTISAKMLDETTILLTPDEIKILREHMPYLISMSLKDLSEMMPEDIKVADPRIRTIPKPNQEPTIGVIDTLFYEDVYFKDWVSYTRMVDEHIPTDTDDCVHGTGVTSIIVDGPTINPELDDGCGRFRVRHFGVAKKGLFSSFTILKKIRDIVSKNRDIKVWNLSLGSVMEINENFISPEAAELDKIQSEYDVVFVVAGTNKSSSRTGTMRIGAPADSLNSLVVNSVNSLGEPASYHRVGPVLSFFNKPDISYYGGDADKEMKTCSPFGERLVKGTSYAAPWISRKMAYLIHNLNLSREVAKALIIDAAAGWNRKDDVSHTLGYGVVPIRIEDIVQTKNDEIKFIMTGSSEEYETYTYNIPIPVYNEKQPFFARATLCYFPKCVRDQGVDYTSTEMDIHFGRVKGEKGRANIKSINRNRQGNDELLCLKEENARKLYRKWDNIKHISDVIKKSSRPRKVYDSGTWGLCIRTKERLSAKNGKGMPFGVVITLKEMNGKNRIDDFIKLCVMKNWIVNPIEITNRVEIFEKEEEELFFE